MTSSLVPQDLVEYIESEIVPRYDSFDMGHQRDHARAVMEQAMELCRHYDVDPRVVYVAAAYHDTGLCEDRKTHHLVSGRIVREDRNLRKWFCEQEIEVIAQAAEDHRASLDHEPRTICGKIIAEADRQIIIDVVIRRAIQFGLKNCPDLTREQHVSRAAEHLREKYSEGGYLKLWIPESPNAGRLKELRELIDDRNKLLGRIDGIYADELLLKKKK